MKKWNLSDLFSKLNLPADQLPPLYTKEEVSYRSIQKKVLDRICSQESITIEKKSHKRNLLLGLAAAAALIGGGAGTYAVSHMGVDTPEKTVTETISSKQSLLAEFATSEAATEAATEKSVFLSDDDALDLSQFREFTNYTLLSEMDELKLEDVQIQRTENAVRLLIQFTPSEPDSLTDDLCAVESFTYSQFSSSETRFSRYSPLCDENHLYCLYEIALEDDQSDVFYAQIGGLVRSEKADAWWNGYSMRHSLASILRDFGYSMAEINSGAAYTEETMAKVQELYWQNGVDYYLWEDVYSSGTFECMFNIVSEDPSDGAETLSEPKDLYMYESVEAEIVGSMDQFAVEEIGMRKDANALKWVVKFVPKYGYTVAGAEDMLLFRWVNYDLSTQVTESSWSSVSIKMKHKMYVNPEEQCIYLEFSTIADELEDAELILHFGSFEEGKYLQLCIPVRDVGATNEQTVTDSFVTEDGMEMHVTLSPETMLLKWHCMSGNKYLPEFMVDPTKEDETRIWWEDIYDKQFSVVTKDGTTYELQTGIHVDNANQEAFACAMFDTELDPENITQILYNDEVIYESE